MVKIGCIILQINHQNALYLTKEEIKERLRDPKRPLVVRFANPMEKRSSSFLEGIGLARKKAYDKSEVKIGVCVNL